MHEKSQHWLSHPNKPGGPEQAAARLVQKILMCVSRMQVNKACLAHMFIGATGLAKWVESVAAHLLQEGLNFLFPVL